MVDTSKVVLYVCIYYIALSSKTYLKIPVKLSH